MSNTFFPIAPQTLRAATGVRGVQPKLAAQSARWGTSTICPRCEGHKAAGAKRCLTCYGEQREYVRTGSRMPQFATSEQPGTLHGLKRRNMVGREVAQPIRGRMVKAADGTWQPADV